MPVGEERRESRGSFIFDPLCVDWSVSSRIRGLCQPSGSFSLMWLQSTAFNTHGSGLEVRAGNEMLHKGSF